MKKALRKTAVLMAGFFTLIVSHFTLTSCQADDAISRDYRCFFIFDTSLHPLPCQLTGILGNTGHFCTIEASHRDGYRQLNTVRNFDGNAETILITTAKENQPGIALGANNRIIVGTSSYDFVLIAYAGQCANCLSNFGGTSYPLSWEQGGQRLHCARCGRSYDVNNGVVAAGDPGRQLLRYMVALDGPVLRVWN